MDSFDIDQKHLSYNVHMQPLDLFLDNKRDFLTNTLHSCFLYFLQIDNIFLPDLHLALPHIHGHNTFQVYIKWFLFDDSLNSPFPLIRSTPSQLFDNTRALFSFSSVFPFLYISAKSKSASTFPFSASCS